MVLIKLLYRETCLVLMMLQFNAIYIAYLRHSFLWIHRCWCDHKANFFQF
jgi:hypothetical protein